MKYTIQLVLANIQWYTRGSYVWWRSRVCDRRVLEFVDVAEISQKVASEKEPSVESNNAYTCWMKLLPNFRV